MKAYFGVDVGGTNVKTAIVSQTGEILHKTSFPTGAERGFDDLCIRLKQTLDEGVRMLHGRSLDVTVVGVGVGMPGFLDVNRGIVVELVNLGWRNVPFVETAQRTLNLPVVIENDANLAALAEDWVGAGRDARCVLCVTLGTGVGGGIVIDGHLHRGVNGMAGEIGHLVVETDGASCNCGNHGCLETLSSATGIVRLAKEKQSAGQIPQGVSITGAEDVMHLIEAGNQAAKQVMDTAGYWLGYGLALSSNVLNPDAIVIGGGVSKAWSVLKESVESSFQRFALPLVTTAATLKVAELGNDAGVIGAARLSMQSV